MANSDELYVAKMVQEILAEEKYFENEKSELDFKLSDFQDPLEEFSKEQSKKTFQEDEIKNVVLELTSKFDVTKSARTFEGVKEIVKLRLIERALYKEIRSRMLVQSKTKNKTTFSVTPALKEYREFSALISDEIKNLYLVGEEKKFVLPSREAIFSNDTYFKIDNEALANNRFTLIKNEQVQNII
jgi:hypothetical protein